MRTLRKVVLGVIASLVATIPLLGHHEWPVDLTAGSHCGVRPSGR
jgi:hypothetical protein